MMILEGVGGSGWTLPGNSFKSMEGISSVREVNVPGYPASHWLTVTLTPSLEEFSSGYDINYGAQGLFLSQSVERDACGCGVGRNGTPSLCPDLPKDLLLPRRKGLCEHL